MSIEPLLEHVERHVRQHAPHLVDLLRVCAGEARFARAWLDDELRRLQPGDSLLEVGGGVFLLATQLAREGFRVTAIEPIGAGFGAFKELGDIVLRLAEQDGVRPSVADCTVEDFRDRPRFALAYSVNVMEHVESPDRAIGSVSSVLAPGAPYRFLCPNYLFPYEPHFNLPTLGSKTLTWRVLRRWIESSARVDDPVGIWRSLNWISVPRVRSAVRADPTLRVEFRTGTLPWMLARAATDPVFAARRAKWIVVVVGLVRRLGILRLAALIPAMLQPIMDARLIKEA